MSDFASPPKNNYQSMFGSPAPQSVAGKPTKPRVAAGYRARSTGTKKKPLIKPSGF